MEIQVVRPAPVLNTQDFTSVFGGPTGRQIPLNGYGHPHHFEFVALPPLRFNIEETLPRGILRVSTPRYPSSPLFVDSRFTTPIDSTPKPLFPSAEEIARAMEQLLGTPYVWGGNWSPGIPELLLYYPPQGPLDTRTEILWTWSGVDCSGLLYQVTRGLTPRNTSELISFGHSVPVENLRPRDIQRLLRPMDMVVWPGHVWFVLDEWHSIESKSPFGVIRRPLLERIEETICERNESFFIRRFADRRTRPLPAEPHRH